MLSTAIGPNVTPPSAERISGVIAVAEHARQVRRGHGRDGRARADLAFAVRAPVGDAHACAVEAHRRHRRAEADDRAERRAEGVGQAGRAAAHVAARGRPCPRRARRAPTSPTARSRPDRRASGSRAPRRCGTRRDAACRGSRGTSRRRGASARAGGRRRRSPPAGASSFMYASASRLTLSPARANETRPASESGSRNGSSSGRTSRTIRPPRWMFSIEPVIGMTSRPSSPTMPADHRVGRRKHVRADAEREIAALLRPDAAADAIRRFEHHGVAVAQAVRRTRGRRSPRRRSRRLAPQPRSSPVGHVECPRELLGRAADERRDGVQPLPCVRRTSGPVTETIATGRPRRRGRRPRCR